MERLRLLALLPTLLGVSLAVAAMATGRPGVWGLALVFGALVAACGGLLALLGYFEPAGEDAGGGVPISALLAPSAAALAAGAGFVLAVRGAVSGALPAWAPSELVIPVAAAAMLSAGVRVARCFGALDGWRRREGLGLVAVTLLIYLPGLGKTTLIDPWETHYGEVAREILARNDWISFWWAQDGFFWSKPPLALWLEALSFSLFGVDYAPDRMLAGAAHGLSPEPEWAVRLPAMVLAVVAVYFSYRLVARRVGRRAGLLAGGVLMTTPFWSLLARQATTDMPYVAALTVAVALIGLGLSTDSRARVRTLVLSAGGLRLRVHAGHALLGAVAFAAVAQICYLLSRHFTLGPDGLLVHGDQFLRGSGGGLCGAGIPGNEGCATLYPEHALAQPALLALLWAAALISLLVAQRGEDRAQRLYFLGAWFALSLSVLGKGAPGLVLPLAVGGGFVALALRLRELERFELPALAAILVCVALPWYAQAFARHGQPFFDRLFLHDMYARAFEHVHDTNAGDDVSVGYYVWQLGYGLFPWSAWAAVGGLAALRGATSASSRTSLLTLLACWFVLSFAMFAVALTKYHHYILPAVVPAALLAGLVLERGFSSQEADGVSPAVSALRGLSGLAAGALVVLVGRDLGGGGRVEGQARLMHLFTYNYSRPWPASLELGPSFWFVAVLAGCFSALWLVPRLRRLSVIALLATGLGFCVFVVNVYFAAAAPHFGQRELLLEYYARREGAHQPLVAYRMNWKGENFYTGNRVAVFVASGAPFRAYLGALRARKASTVFVMTEHHRKDSLLEELGAVRRFQTLTGPARNDKFFLARVDL